MNWLRDERGRDFASYDELWRWSVEDLEGFWASLWDFFGIGAPYDPTTGITDLDTLDDVRDLALRTGWRLELPALEPTTS